MKTVEEIKKEIADWANKDFYLEMQSNWSNDEFKQKKEIRENINILINLLKENYNIEAKYNTGYKIEYKEM